MIWCLLWLVCPLWDFKCVLKIIQKCLSSIVCPLLIVMPFLSTSCAQKAAGLWISLAEINREAGRENYFPLLLERRLAFHIFIWSCAVGFQWLAALWQAIQHRILVDEWHILARVISFGSKSGWTTCLRKGHCGHGYLSGDLLVRESVNRILWDYGWVVVPSIGSTPGPSKWVGKRRIFGGPAP